ncbi:hypothetical protein GCM10009740_02380 [Terrabacter terrae]|uniref:Uncharacterized protein n=1 Tax=Terrabacter terrae TaxID=318434 RepID=A0ABN2TSN1_9MICO
MNGPSLEGLLTGAAVSLVVALTAVFIKRRGGSLHGSGDSGRGPHPLDVWMLAHLRWLRLYAAVTLVFVFVIVVTNATPGRWFCFGFIAVLYATAFLRAATSFVMA